MSRRRVKADGKLDRKVLEFLVCPVTRTGLTYDPEQGELRSAAAGLAFPIRDGIAIMLVSEARPLDKNGPTG